MTTMAALNATFSSPEAVTVGFYHFLNDGQYTEAFHCLTSSFQNRWVEKGMTWEQGLASFAKGYIHTRAITNIETDPVRKEDIKLGYSFVLPEANQEFSHKTLETLSGSVLGDDMENIKALLSEATQEILKVPGMDQEKAHTIPLALFFQRRSPNLSSDPENAVHLHVTYDDHVHTLSHPLLDALPQATLGQTEESFDAIEKFARDTMIIQLNANLKGTADAMLSHLFRPNNVETCFWLGKVKAQRYDTGFERILETIEQYRRAVCVETDQGWKIEGLRYR